MRHLLLLPLITAASMVAADPAVIREVQAEATDRGWTFHVTIEHPDTGWGDYADGWRVEDADGNVLGFRELLHPHVNEQPFTRSLSGVVIPAGVTEVFIRARTNVTDWDTATEYVVLPH
ncbi:MAG: hypothetical protein AAFR35_06445 [Pseudomonadota bacterium]